MWPSNSDMLLGDDFDLNSIPPIELGLPKFGEDMSLREIAAASSSAMGPTGYEHGFGQGLEDTQYHDDSQGLNGMLGFDEMMAGHGF